MTKLIRSQNVRAIHYNNPTMPKLISQTGWLGGNISGSSDYNVAWYYLNVMDSSRGWQNTLTNDSAVLDSNGWPIVASYNVISAEYANNYEQCAPGNYPMCYEVASTDSSTLSVNGGNFTKISVGPGAGTDVKVTGILTVTNNILVIYFSGSVRNVQIMRPGYLLTEVQKYNPDMVKYLTRFSCMRFMDFMSTNRGTAAAPPDGTWINRTTPNLHFNSPNGKSFEDIILLSNNVKSYPGNILTSIWINIVATADDDYITKACTLLKNTLDTNLVIYLELSNEVWNSVFQGASAYFTAKGLTDTTLAYDGSSDTSTLQQRAYAKRVRQMALIAESVFGVGSLNSTVNVVLGCQSYMGLDKLKYLETVFTDRPPNSYISGITGGSYFTLGDITATGLTPAQLIAACYNVSTLNSSGYANSGDATIPSILKDVMVGKSIAVRYNMKLLGYEGGPGWDQLHIYANQVTAYNANLEPTMVKLISDFIIALFRCGIDMFNFYGIGPGLYSPNENGNWSGNRYINTLDPKLQGVLNVMALPIPVPSEIQALNKITLLGISALPVQHLVRFNVPIKSTSGTTLSQWFGNLPVPSGTVYNIQNSCNMTSITSPWIDFTVYVEQAGNYAVTLSCLINSVTPVSYNFLLNPSGDVGGTIIGNVSVAPASLTNSTFLSYVPNRANSTAYIPGQVIKSLNNSSVFFVCTQKGISDTSLPSSYAAATTDGTLVADGTSIFKATTTLYTSYAAPIPVPSGTIVLPQGWQVFRIQALPVTDYVPANPYASPNWSAQISIGQLALVKL